MGMTIVTFFPVNYSFVYTSKSTTMQYITIALFAIAAILGVTILVNLLNKRNAPRGVVYSHGIFAAIALVLLIVYVVNNRTNAPTTSLILFVLAALGGFFMFIRDMSNKNIPVAVAVLHALLAVAGFVTLLIFVFA
jgi:hypothetical protein